MELIQCSFCKRKTPNQYLEKHHLIPRSKKGKEIVPTCCDCGDQIHLLFSNKELEKEYNIVEKLLANERMKKWVKWISNKNFGVCMKIKKKRK